MLIFIFSIFVLFPSTMPMHMEGYFWFQFYNHIDLLFWRGISLIIFSHRESWYISARLERFYSIIFLGVLLLPGF